MYGCSACAGAGICPRLKSAAGFLRHELGARLNLRHTPQLQFVPDDSIAYGAHIFDLLSKHNINVDIILQSSGSAGCKDVIFTCSKGEAETARAVLESNKTRFGTDKITVNNDCAKVSIVGAGMQSHPGTASTMFEALYSQNINIHMISTSEIKISVIIDKADADRAVAAIHDAFIQ